MVNNAELKALKDPRFRPLIEAIERAERGDKEALSCIREWSLTTCPQLWESYGDLSIGVEGNLIRVVAGDNALQREALTSKVDEIRQQLLGPNPSPMERLLVQRIVLCWIQAYYEDGIDIQGLAPGTSWTQSLNQQRRAHVAHRRLLSAIKSLATVRHLNLPVLQVNIAEKQVNVAVTQPVERGVE